MDQKNRLVKIFLDTNFIVGLYATSDPFHQRCLKISTHLARYPDVRLFISNYVLAEVLTVISQRAGKKIAIATGENLIESKHFTIFQHRAEDDILTWRMFKQVTDKNISFIDIAIIKAMELEGIKNLVTFDAQLAKLAKSRKIKAIQI